MVVWSLPVLMQLNSRFGENHRIIEFLVPNSRTNAARAFAAPAKGHFVRIADIYLFSFEGPLCSPILNLNVMTLKPTMRIVIFSGLKGKIIILMIILANRARSFRLSIPISVVLLREDYIHPVMLIAGHVLIEDSGAPFLRTTCC